MTAVAAPLFNYSTPNALWCGVLAETLVRCGLREVVLSPGSRSSPLTLALASHPGLRCLPVLDERSAGFLALGIAKGARRPVALVCTSGTAVANWFPAVIEAREAGVPLLLLSADRPPELRACGAGQTIDQQKIFGNFVSFFHEFGLPEASPSALAYLRQMLAQAILRSQSPLPGPVHLNFPFRDPLIPSEGEALRPLAGTVESEAFWQHLRPFTGIGRPAVLPELLNRSHGLIIAGPLADTSEPVAHASAVMALAEKLGWPVLADPLSQVPAQIGSHPLLIRPYDALLRAKSFAAHSRPEAFLCFGALPTSKVLRAWLSDCATMGIPLAMVGVSHDSRDAVHGCTQVLDTDAPQLLAALAAQAPQDRPESAWCTRWQEAAALAASQLAQDLDTLPGLAEPRLSRLVEALLPETALLMVANSMPVRDLEYFWSGRRAGFRLCFNRGANGIDGTLSTAFGLACLDRPVVLLTGDLSFLHDSNALLLRRHLQSSLTILLINNHGGGIFEHLPVASLSSLFEEFFATPQDVDFASLAEAHDIPFVPVRDEAALRQAFAVLPQKGVRILEVQTDRREDAALRKRLLASAAAACEALASTG